MDTLQLQLLLSIMLYPSKLKSSVCYTLPYRPNLPFLISDIRALALSPECQNAQMSETKNGGLSLCGTEIQNVSL